MSTEEQVSYKHYTTIDKGILDIEWELNQVTNSMNNVKRKLAWLLADVKKGQVLKRQVTWDGKLMYEYSNGEGEN